MPDQHPDTPNSPDRPTLPPPDVVPPAHEPASTIERTSDNLLLLLYLIAGALGGAACGLIVFGFDYALYRFDYWWRGPGPLLSLGPRDPDFCAIIPALLAGMVVGTVPCGLVLWPIVIFWPAARHPTCAASLCASLIGTLCLVHLAWGMSIKGGLTRKDLIPAAARVGAVMLLGAIYGFTATVIARTLEKRARRNGHVEPPG